MLDKDTFYTVKYRGHWIHCHHDRIRKREVCRVQAPNGNTVGKSGSFETAKRNIRKRTNKTKRR